MHYLLKNSVLALLLFAIATPVLTHASVLSFVEQLISMGHITFGHEQQVRDLAQQYDAPQDPSTNTQCLVLNESLWLGSNDVNSGGEVSLLQTFLDSINMYSYSEITGYFGESTEFSVKNFQCAYGVVCEGEAETTGYGQVGPQTRQKIYEVSCESTQDQTPAEESVTYMWTSGEWSVCQSTQQTRVVSCTGSDGNTYSTSSCTGVKPEETQSCSAGPGNETETSQDRCGGLTGDALQFCGMFNEDIAVAREALIPKGGEISQWFVSYVMQAYIDMYRATKNTVYLDEFLTFADAVWASSDEARGIKDFKGSSSPCWSDKFGSVRMCQVAHTGMILYPMTQFVKEIYADSELTQYKGKADSYLTNIERSVGSHNYRFKDVSYKDVKIKSDEGFYFWAGNDPSGLGDVRGWNLPHNQQLAMGATLLALYDINQNRDYFDKARRLGRVFWRDLSTKSGAYLWHYWWGSSLKGRSDKYEDTGHAGIDMIYVMQAYKQGFNVVNSTTPFPTQSDMKKFARTFTDNIYTSNGDYKDRVDGTRTSSDDGDPRRAAQWVDFAEFDPSVYDKTKKTLLEAKLGDSNAAFGALGFARLTKWAVIFGR